MECQWQKDGTLYASLTEDMHFKNTLVIIKMITSYIYIYIYILLKEIECFNTIFMNQTEISAFIQMNYPDLHTLCMQIYFKLE